MKLTKSILLRNSALAGICLLSSVIGAHAANLTVNTCADNGAGSLRQAIIDATVNAAANTINIDIPVVDPCYNSKGNSFTLDLQSQLPDLPLAPLTIDNNMSHLVLLVGNDTFRIFTLVDSAVVTINNIYIKQGFSSMNGGAIFMGASSTLNLTGSNVASNNASGNGGGIYMNNSSTLHLSKTNINGNVANAGGAIYLNNSATLNIDSSTLYANQAISGNGGAIFNGTSGTITATSITLDGNAAGGFGGGIYNNGTLTMTNSTVASNQAASGGGIYNNFTTTLNNNLVALNTLSPASSSNGDDLYGGVSGGLAFTGTYNLIGNVDNSAGVDSGTNRVGHESAALDPMLAGLSDNGGLTLTRALLNGSPAIDKGNSSIILLDQRGRPRPFDDPLIANDAGNGADMGAFEFELGPSAAEVSVSGRIVTMADSSERGIAGATISLTANDGDIQTIRTNAFGYFQFSGVVAGKSYIVQIQHKQYQFNAETLTVLDEIADLNYLALPAPTQLGRNSQRR